MKTWEMIKELTENPKKEFISKGSGPFADLKAYWFRDEHDVENMKIINLNCKNEVYKYPLNRKWEEVKKPVDFMTAITSGKYISVKCAIETYEGKGKLREIYYRQPSEMLRTLAGYGDKIAIDIILNGEWYIED